ncbi:unnamed protein product [Ectocarpus sp. 6 AP-2014]
MHSMRPEKWFTSVQHTHHARCFGELRRAKPRPSNSLDNLNGVLCGIKKEGKKTRPHRVPQSTECCD